MYVTTLTNGNIASIHLIFNAQTDRAIFLLKCMRLLVSSPYSHFRYTKIILQTVIRYHNLYVLSTFLWFTNGFTALCYSSSCLPITANETKISHINRKWLTFTLENKGNTTILLFHLNTFDIITGLKPIFLKICYKLQLQQNTLIH